MDELAVVYLQTYGLRRTLSGSLAINYSGYIWTAEDSHTS